MIDMIDMIEMIEMIEMTPIHLWLQNIGMDKMKVKSLHLCAVAQTLCTFQTKVQTKGI